MTDKDARKLTQELEAQGLKVSSMGHGAVAEYKAEIAMLRGNSGEAKTVKIVLNKGEGTYRLSGTAENMLVTLGVSEIDADNYGAYNIQERKDPRLIQTIETLGIEASSGRAELEVIEIPEGVDVYIEYRGGDHGIGPEELHESHRVFR